MRTPLLFTLALLIYLCPLVSVAQQELPYGSAQDAILPEWTKLMYSPSPDAGLVVEAYNAYYESHPFVKNGHTQYYKRWLRSIARELPPLKKPREHQRQSRSSIAQWESIGPWDWDHEAIDRSYAPGAAHVYTVEQSYSNPDILYAGTATAGVWKSEDRGLSWTAVSDGLRTGSVTALTINSLDPETLYAELLGSIYKTTTGGTNWSPTGDGAFQALALDVKDIVMDPEDTSRVYVATQLALYRTTNGGATWSTLLSGDFLEIEFHPTQPDTLYVVKHNGDKTEFYRSIDDGASFQLQSSGWPNPNTSNGEHQRRTEIAVTPDAPDHVYALATGLANGGSGLYGVYISEDAGSTWAFQCCGPQPAGTPSLSNPNLMGWRDDGLDDGGQYYYDLAFAVSPTNADSMYVCGVNLWVSDDGGQSFICPAKWSHSYKANYVHADIHDIRFYPGTQEIWVAGDGGIFRSIDEGASFTRKMSGISGTDFWGFGAGYWDGEVMLGGTYHNGTLLKDNDVYLNGWVSTDGGDNYRGFVNPGEEREVYSDYNIKTLSGDRLIKNGTRSFVYKPNAGYTIGVSSDMLFHPQYFGTWYIGNGTRLWKTEDDGYTYFVVHDFGVDQDITAMEISRSNPDVIYVSTWPGWNSTKHIFRTENAGINWIDVTPPSGQLGGNTWVPYDIAVDATNPMKVWIVRTSMYGDTDLDGVSVFSSDNGGTTWQNITTATLDDEAFTCIMHQAGTNGGVYLGTRESVYYRNASMGDWGWYGDGLPVATFSTRLIPYYREGKLRNGTNRSVWESPFYESSSPIAQPSILSYHHACLQDTVFYRDHSVVSENGASWLWQFPGGTPATSTERNPKVLYSATGIYNATLIVSDVNGTDSTTAIGIIEVRGTCSLDTVPGSAIKCFRHPDYVIVPDLGLTSNTVTITAWVRPNGIQPDYTGIVMSDGAACGLNFREGNNTLGYHWAGSSQSWPWDSNLEVPPNEWSHVAIVVTPTAVHLYVNGKEATHNISYAPVNLTTMKIGSYQGWQARNLDGAIDEVCIWNRSLSIDEIRGLRHLTKIPEDDPDLYAYYQFNEGSSLVYDKAGTNDAIINGGATRTKSRAPVGAGVSQSMNITAPGVYDFDETGFLLSFPTGSVVPNGPVFVSRLNVAPDSIMANYVPMDHGYWILNNYGTNVMVSNPDTISLFNLAFISEAMRDTLGNALYLREENREINGWEISSLESGLTEQGVAGFATFSEIDLTELGQVIAMRDSMQFGRPKVAMVHESDTVLFQRGGSSMALSVKSGSKGLLLPSYDSVALENVPSPTEGSVVYVSDKKQIACYDGTEWRLLRAEYLKPPVYAGLPELSGFSLAGGSTASALLSLGFASGVLVLPSFTSATVVNIDFPKEGLLIYRSDLHQLTCYDGVDWIYPEYTLQSVPASDDTPTENLYGIRIGIGTKDPNALLQIIDPARALGIPIARNEEVEGPHAGLIVFDPVLKALCLFDGVGWKAVK